MTAYVVVDITIRDQQAYERYKVLAAPAVATYGGRYLVRGGAADILEGSWLPRRFVVLEFPSVEAGRAWWDSAEYAPAKALRQTCADTKMIVVEGVSNP
jgi:uncharacterized protein (DUF1330 family)